MIPVSCHGPWCRYGLSVPQESTRLKSGSRGACCWEMGFILASLWACLWQAVLMRLPYERIVNKIPDLAPPAFSSPDSRCHCLFPHAVPPQGCLQTLALSEFPEAGTALIQASPGRAFVGGGNWFPNGADLAGAMVIGSWWLLHIFQRKIWKARQKLDAGRGIDGVMSSGAMGIKTQWGLQIVKRPATCHSHCKSHHHVHATPKRNLVA